MLVLVMTLLGILFVVGVAFLATMNFEADMISAERQRKQSVGGVEAAMTDMGAMLRNGVMAGPGAPFGDASAALARASFAELPGVHKSFSAVEPSYVPHPGNDGILNTGDDNDRAFGGALEHDGLEGVLVDVDDVARVGGHGASWGVGIR